MVTFQTKRWFWVCGLFCKYWEGNWVYTILVMLKISIFPFTVNCPFFSVLVFLGVNIRLYLLKLWNHTMMYPPTILFRETVNFDADDEYELRGSALPEEWRLGDLSPYVALIGVFLLFSRMTVLILCQCLGVLVTYSLFF